LKNPIELTSLQEKLIKSIPDIRLTILRRYEFRDIFNAIRYVVKTGVQWKRLPPNYPKWKIVYHHFRSWSCRGWFHRILETLLYGKRGSLGLAPYPATGIIDSQSVRSAIPHSVKGIDGHKKIKGIKRHLCVDSNGYFICVNVTTANVHDTRGICPVIAELMANIPSVKVLKGDKGYSDHFADTLRSAASMELKTVKSNFGTTEFIPMEGRWVVERSFSWLENYRRLTRNYELKLHTAQAMVMVAAVAFMLRYF
jgi:putative transposase